MEVVPVSAVAQTGLGPLKEALWKRIEKDRGGSPLPSGGRTTPPAES